jgi:molybdopterin converting factor subunit 1
MNHIKVIFFASYRERAGTKEISLDLPEGASVLDLKSILQDTFPGLINALNSSLVAVNRQYSFNDDLIPDGAEVAVFPPVSGGEVVDINHATNNTYNHQDST